MSHDVAEWLQGLGLGIYAAAFQDHAIDADVLRDLSEADLEKIGVKLGHRKKLLRAIAVRGEEKPGAAVPPERNREAPEENLALWERHPGERKPVTLLFADITGSTALTETLDPEEAHELLYGAIHKMCEAVESNRGTVCRFMGDGLMAMFGAPRASEHHAVDACAAALDMQRAVHDYAAAIGRRHGARLQIRVGLHSGEVVVLTVGDADKVEYDASGPTVPVAARMEQAARPGEVWITSATRALAAHRIEATALEAVSVKGVSAPVSVFVLHRVSLPEEVQGARARMPFVGRRAEIRQFSGILEACLEEGQGQTVCVRGEPGIGKTRLVEEFARVTREGGADFQRALVLPFGVGKGQDAVRMLIRGLLGIAPGSGVDARTRVAEEVLGRGTLHAEQAVFLYDLLDIPQPTEQRSVYDAMSNAMRNEGKRALLSRLVTIASQTRPTVVAVEDVHWADAITLTQLAAVAKTVAQCPALLVMTSRIEGDPLDQGWRSAAQGSPFSTIDLGPLREQDSVALVSGFIDPSDRLAERCLSRAAGNPLFLEQLLSTARESAAETLPDSIQSLVLARLDRLHASDKRALQAASVIGQRFDLAALRYLLGESGYECRELVEHNLIRPEGDGYLFTHALIQEGVHGSLLKRQRQELHGQAARWFESSDRVLHAEHLWHAGDVAAPGAFLAAAREQGQQYRFERSLALVERGLGARPEQAISHQLLCLKGHILLDLGDVKAAMQTFREACDRADGDVQRAEAWMGLAAGMRVSTDYAAALGLLEKTEPVAVRHGLVLELSRLHHMRGNLFFSLGRVEECREEHRRALDYARECGSVEDEARAVGGLGDAEYARGRMRSARDYLTTCLERCREQGLGRIEVANRAQLGHAMTFCGEWRQAGQEFEAAICAAQAVGHLRAQMNAGVGLLFLLAAAGDWSRQDQTNAWCLDLAKQLGARAWEPMLLAHHASGLLARGEVAEARAVLRDAERRQEACGSAAFTAGEVFGVMLLAAQSEPERASALRKAEQVLQGRCLSHVYLRFYWYLMEASLEAGDWVELERAARALETFTRVEPLPGVDFWIDRGRALAAFARGVRGDETRRELRRLRDVAADAGLVRALERLDDAVATV
jgi:class 3 adenylate cyclase/tetratricopeptide (TPR) repeat protein